MSRIERLIKNLCGFSPLIRDDKTDMQRDIDADQLRGRRANPWRHQYHKGVYAPRTLQEAGL